MFEKLDRTKYPPRDKPLMIWDGECGFCRYWISRWKKITGEKVDYKPYQEVASGIIDIDIIHFKRASRLIETDGTIYSGPRSAFRTFTYGSRWAFLDRWYVERKWFTRLSDWLYDKVAKNRNLLFRLTKAFYGSNPDQPRPFWVIYLALVLYLYYYLTQL